MPVLCENPSFASHALRIIFPTFTTERVIYGKEMDGQRLNNQLPNTSPDHFNSTFFSLWIPAIQNFRSLIFFFLLIFPHIELYSPKDDMTQ